MHMTRHDDNITKPRERDNRDRDKVNKTMLKTSLAQRLTRIDDPVIADTIIRLWVAIFFLFGLWAISIYYIPNRFNSAIMEAYIDLQAQQVPNNLPYGLNFTIN